MPFQVVRANKNAFHPGASTKEKAILADDYYFGKGFGFPNSSEISDDDIRKCIRKSTDSSLDVEKSENHRSNLVMLLAVAGDDRFSKILSTENIATQKATGKFAESFWTYYNLSYPKTQHIIKLAEQGAAANP